MPAGWVNYKTTLIILDRHILIPAGGVNYKSTLIILERHIRMPVGWVNHNTTLFILDRHIRMPAGWVNYKTILTHISLAPFLWNIGKQNRPRCDAAKRGVRSGAIQFAILIFIEN